MYTDVNVNISDSQKQKVKKALAAGTQFSLRLSHEDLVGNAVIAVTQSQFNRLIYEERWMWMRGRNGRTGIVLKTYEW